MDRRYVIVRPARSRLGRFVAVGAVATGVDVVGAVVLAGIWPRVPADLVALVVASTLSGLLHRRVTLRGDEFDRWIRRPGVFAGVALVAGAVDVSVFSLLPLAPLAAKLIALTAAALVRVVAHRVVLFRVVRRDQARPARRPPPPGELRLSVVIPAYDEEARIGATVAAVREALSAVHDDGGVEIIVVDDGSTDATADAARRGGADRVVVQRPNRGKGAAVRAGVAVARGRTIVFTDADLSYPPHQIVGVLAAVEEGWDLVIGDRRHTDTTTRAPAP
ncbi:MAG: glycosyltransferase, partial [Actinomyces sp.]